MNVTTADEDKSALKIDRIDGYQPLRPYLGLLL
ncbi:hypothetical protein swp_3590 [Shewanella piezotolerans WP3]|uniref:Uncharacterized protein n=1 Tax=Shewanella piezotolerans (strain WP3 / JCM 13877) TaxID=225849 RepID=B8CQF1_SHEPW|nr:hypothetical protein swp_3590 [Shewanella piezotolerans WP3]